MTETRPAALLGKREGAALVVIVPTRGRPQAAAELAAAFEDTSAGAADLAFVIDSDDPDLDEYYRTLWQAPPGWLLLNTVPHSNMNGALNLVAHRYAHPVTSWRHVGFMGDDHRPRTQDWDRKLVERLDEREPGGIAYADDLFQGARLPTQVFMDKRIVHALGWMAPPQLAHLFLDDFWLRLGNALGSLTYCGDVVVEHLHPHAGKAPEDPQYHAAWANWEADRAKFDAYMAREFVNDVRRVAAALPGGLYQ